jgi:hypothetical protein
MKKLVIAMAAGAALAWFLDPDNGSHRRDSLKRTLQDKGLISPTGSSPSPAPTTVDTDPLASSVAAIR